MLYSQDIEEDKVFDSIEIKETFIFHNEYGCVTIKQSRGWLDEEDTIILIPINKIEDVVKALRKAKKARG